jgi:hypothetical protein
LSTEVLKAVLKAHACSPKGSSSHQTVFSCNINHHCCCCYPHAAPRTAQAGTKTFPTANPNYPGMCAVSAHAPSGPRMPLGPCTAHLAKTLYLSSIAGRLPVPHKFWGDTQSKLPKHDLPLEPPPPGTPPPTHPPMNWVDRTRGTVPWC